jgi:small-conductance mechanosensitive channel/Na+-transporting methylmalonyl-CoA/oxaloacetate decarboxylase gamma subunit
VLGLLLAAFGLFTGAQLQAAEVADGEPGGAAKTTLPEEFTREEVREMVSRLSDGDVRELLIRQLDKGAVSETPPEDEPAGFVETMDAELATVSGRLVQMLDAVPKSSTFVTILVDRITEGSDSSHIWVIIFFTIVIFAGGAAGEWAFRRLFTRIAEQPMEGAPQSLIDKLCILSLRLLVDVLAIAVFGLVTVALFHALYVGHEPTRKAIAAIFWTVIVIRLTGAAMRFALAPNQPWLRIPPLDGPTAAAISHRFILVIGVFASTLNLYRVYQAFGLGPGLLMLYGMVASFVFLVLIVILVWQGRETISRLIREGAESGGQPPGRVRELMASNAHVLVICFIALIWLMSIGRRLLTGEGAAVPIITSLAVVALIPVVDWILRTTLTHLLRVSQAPVLLAAPAAESAEQDAAAEAQEEARKAFESEKRDYDKRLEYLDVLAHNIRLILAVVCVVILARVWDINIQGIAAKGMGQDFAGSLFDIVVALVLASAVWGIVKTAIRHTVPEEPPGAPGESEAGGQGKTRLQTLIPLLGNFALITLAVVVMLIVLSELGVDIGPLIAGAGVIGLAVGFGAQALVKDIISGFFFLLDDAFRVGEYIDVGEVRGTVEHISIRSFRLRHHRGLVHTIPFGEIRHLTNYSRDWVIMKLELRVPFDADTEKVRKIIKKVGQELMEDPEHGPSFLQPLKSQGVNRMDDSALILRVKFMAKPGEQFVLRRVIFRAIQEAFTANGIRFAPRRVIVDTSGASGAGAGAAAAAAAAAAATDEGGLAKDDPGADSM